MWWYPLLHLDSFYVHHEQLQWQIVDDEFANGFAEYLIIHHVCDSKVYVALWGNFAE